MNHRLGRLDESKGKHENIYLLGLSLSGDPELLKTALAKLKAKGVEVTWISALEMPADIAGLLEGVLEDRSRETRAPASTLLEEVGKAFGVDVEALMREHKEMNAGLAGRLELKSKRIPDKLEDAIRMHIRRVYEKYGQNLSRAAEALDVSRNTVRKYL